MLHSMGWEHAKTVREFAFLILGAFVFLVFYRIWEAFRFEFTWPSDD